MTVALPTLATPRLRVEHATAEHAALHPAFFARNRPHFAPWEPPRPAGIETESYWRTELEKARDEFSSRHAVRFVIFLRDQQPRELIGRINFMQIFGGPFQSCVLGYQIDRRHEGRGLMHEALTACLDYMFREFGLHRVQAGYRPQNERSARLLARLGFQTIGIARDYLFIDGAWRDHVLTALTNPAFDTAVLRR